MQVQVSHDPVARILCSCADCKRFDERGSRFSPVLATDNHLEVAAFLSRTQARKDIGITSALGGLTLGPEDGEFDAHF